jgi:hypothetical protein
MNTSSSGRGNYLPSEYRKIAERLFPSGGFISGKGLDVKSAAGFAESLGIGADYQRLLTLDRNSAEMQTFLEHFQNNLDLLIQKTWVEKADEKRKAKLQDDTPSLMITIKQGNFSKAVEQFGSIIQELAYLFFFFQSEKEDFTEYTFRIDEQMGLFWWYGGRLSLLKETIEINEAKDKTGKKDEKALWSVLLLGICYLTNF